MNRTKTVGILMGAAILANVSIASAQRWGVKPRHIGVCFYEDINFGGRYFCSPVGSTTSAVPSGMNDRFVGALWKRAGDAVPRSELPRGLPGHHL
jgi:hypothetical protein